MQSESEIDNTKFKKSGMASLVSVKHYLQARLEETEYEIAQI